MGQKIKQVKGKVLAKHETEAIWDESNYGAGVAYVPELGEKVIYDPDDQHLYPRVKYGDGINIVKYLPFSIDPYAIAFGYEQNLSEKEKARARANLGMEYINEELQNLQEAFNEQVGQLRTDLDTQVEDLQNNKFDKAGGTIEGDLRVAGDLIVSGESTETHLENVTTPQNTIILRDDQAGGLLEEEYTGLIAKKYDGTNDGMLVFDKEGTAYVGDVGDVQPLATRAPETQMRDGGLVEWNSATKRLQSTDKPVVFNSTEATEELVVYTRDVPDDSADYAYIGRVGGMTRKCKNLLPYPYAETTKTTNGVTCTDNGDGTITVNGTATNQSNFFFVYNEKFSLPAGTYTFSVDYIIPSNVTVWLFKTSESRTITYLTAGEQQKTFTLAKEESFNVYLYVGAGAIFSNAVLKPMLNEGATALPYEPYFEGLRSAPVTEVESVGVNLFDESQITHATTGAGVVSEAYGVVQDGVLIAKMGYHNYGIIWKPFAMNLGAGTYTISADCYISTGGAPNLRVVARLYNVKTQTHTSDTVISLSAFDKWERISAQITVTEPSEYMLCVQGVGNAEMSSDMDVRFKNICVAKGNIAEYSPYKKKVFQIPEAVQALDGYGEGLDSNNFNSVEWSEDGKRVFNRRVKTIALDGSEKWYITGGTFWTHLNNSKKSQGTVLSNRYACNIIDVLYVSAASTGVSTVDEFKAALNADPLCVVYILDTPETTDISDLLPADNFIEVEGNGTLTFKNEFRHGVPSEVTFYKGSNDIIGADTFVGDLAGTAARAVSDKNGNDIAETYAKKTDVPTKVSELDNDAEYITADVLSGLGGGDMLKSVYDTNGDGIVDKARADKNGNPIDTTYAKLISSTPQIIQCTGGDTVQIFKSNKEGETYIGFKDSSNKSLGWLGMKENMPMFYSTDNISYKLITEANISSCTVAKASEADLATKATQDASGNTITSTYATKTELDTHTSNKSNPHGVTKAQVGLGNVDNTADADKNVASATKLTTARNINGVAFDGTSDIAVYSANELPRFAKLLKTNQWYRIATIAETHGFSCTLQFTSSYDYTIPQSTTLAINARYDTDCSIVQLSNTNVSVISKVRAVRKLGAEWYIEIYYTGDTRGNPIQVVFSNLASYGEHPNTIITKVDFTDGTIPDGYTATEFELSSNPVKATTFEGDLVGVATKAISDKNGNNIVATYATKDEIANLGIPNIQVWKSAYEITENGNFVAQNCGFCPDVVFFNFHTMGDEPTEAHHMWHCAGGAFGHTDNVLLRTTSTGFEILDDSHAWSSYTDGTIFTYTAVKFG